MFDRCVGHGGLDVFEYGFGLRRGARGEVDAARRVCGEVVDGLLAETCIAYICCQLLCFSLFVSSELSRTGRFSPPVTRITLPVKLGISVAGLNVEVPLPMLLNVCVISGRMKSKSRSGMVVLNSTTIFQI